MSDSTEPKYTLRVISKQDAQRLDFTLNRNRPYVVLDLLGIRKEFNLWSILPSDYACHEVIIPRGICKGKYACLFSLFVSDEEPLHCPK